MNNYETWLTAKEIAEANQTSEKNFRDKVARKKGIYKGIQSRYETTPNGRIIKYLASSLPTQMQEQIQGLLQIGSTQNGNALHLASQFGDDATIEVGAEIVKNSLELTAEALLPIIRNLGFSPHDHSQLMTDGCSYGTAGKVSRKRAVVRWWRENAKKLKNEEAVEAFAYATLQALKQVHEYGNIGKHFFVLGNDDLPQPKGVDNANPSKMKDTDITDFLRAHYARGNNPSKQSVYQAYCQSAPTKGWSPVSYQTICNWLKPMEAECLEGRMGAKRFGLDVVLTTDRAVPEAFGDVWSMDGTPANVWVVNDKFQPRQCGYKMVCVDVATRFVVTELIAGKSEKASDYISLFKAMVRATKRLPRVVQTDYFSDYREFQAYLEALGITMSQPKIGNARAKIVESVLGFITVLIERYNPAFNGLNATARELRLSDEHQKNVAYPNAMSFAQAKLWAEEFCMAQWNNRMMDTLGGKPCGKSPLQLFLEKSNTDNLCTPEKLATVTGEMRLVSLTMRGLSTNRHGYEYTYLPAFDTFGAEEIAQWLLLYKGQQFAMYITDFDAPVLVHHHETQKEVGWFIPKERAEYDPTLLTEAGKKALGQHTAIGKAQVKQAQSKRLAAQEKFPSTPKTYDTPLAIVDGEVVDTSTGEVLASDPNQAHDFNRGLKIVNGEVLAHDFNRGLKGGTDKGGINDAEEAFKLGIDLPTLPTQTTATTVKAKKKADIDKSDWVMIEGKFGEMKLVPRTL